MKNRIIKFRAWDKGNGKIVPSAIVHIDQYGEITLPYSDKTIMNPILMQFTGLKDKNDGEIYEGDIVLDANGEKHEVRFIDGAFKMVDMNGCDFDLKFAWEVIGNIYQDSHLLENK